MIVRYSRVDERVLSTIFENKEILATEKFQIVFLVLSIFDRIHELDSIPCSLLLAFDGTASLC